MMPPLPKSASENDGQWQQLLRGPGGPGLLRRAASPLLLPHRALHPPPLPTLHCQGQP